MSYFQVEPAGLVSAGTAVKTSVSDLASALQSVNGSSAAAAGTPAAGAYETLVADAGRQVQSLQNAVDGLSQALDQAAANYTASDQSATAAFGGRAR
jgi:uncharacterized protein YukE